MSRKRRTQANFQSWGPSTTAENSKSLMQSPVGDHFATRTRANDFVRLMRTLPDPDPVLRKMGRDITALQELLTDSHLESVWSVRCSAVSGSEWFLSAGGDGRREQEAVDAFTEELSALDLPRIMEEMMDAVAYGYAPLEIIWQPSGSRWGIADIVGKPPQWFTFDKDNRLVFRSGVIGTEDLPENRFLLVRHRPSYANPFGVKVFSKCFWPVTFKKNGFRWWTVFVEKYGGAFLYGKYPNNASEQYKAELLEALERMIADAVAIAPEGAEITIESLANKGGVGNVHAEYIAAANAEISKAILGQTLTTEIGDKGSYAAAKAHNLIREDLAAADRRRVASAFDRLAAVYTYYNFGADVSPPRFQFVQDEDLQADRADRDTKLYAIGWRPRKSYISREYGIAEDDFDLATEIMSQVAGFGWQASALLPASEHPEDCACGCKDIAPTRLSLWRRLAAIFTKTDEDKAREKDDRLLQDFQKQLLKNAQEDLNGFIDTLVDSLGAVASYEVAFAALLAAYDRRSLAECTKSIDEARYTASQIGAARG